MAWNQNQNKNCSSFHKGNRGLRDFGQRLNRSGVKKGQKKEELIREDTMQWSLEEEIEIEKLNGGKIDILSKCYF